jgi:hypothetical protein
VIGSSKGNQDEEYEVRIDLSLVHDNEVSFNTYKYMGGLKTIYNIKSPLSTPSDSGQEDSESTVPLYSLIKKPWSKKEDRRLVRLVKECGNHWEEFTQFFEGRTWESLRQRVITLENNVLKTHLKKTPLSRRKRQEKAVAKSQVKLE